MSNSASRQESAFCLAPAAVSLWMPPPPSAPAMSLWPVAILLSLVLHGLFGWWGLSFPLTPVLEKDKTRVTRISFQREQPAPALSSAKPRPRTTQTTPKPLLKPSPAPAVPRPEPIRGIQPLVEPEPAVATARPAAQIVPAPAPAPPPAAAPKPPDRIRQDYLARLMAHLEEHKFYPDGARRRGLEGTVHIAFTIMADGAISQLQLADGHKMLHQAAAETLRRALPLPPPPREVNVPLAVSYGMTFTLR